MTVYTMNELLYSRIDGTTSNAPIGKSANLYFSDYVGTEPGIPSDIVVNISVYSGAGTTNTPAYAVVKMIGESGEVLFEDGFYQSGVSMLTGNLDFRIPVPLGTKYFICEARIYGYYAGRFVYNGNAKFTLKEMTYSAPVIEPKIVEIDITTSTGQFFTRIVRAFETIKTAVMKVFESKAIIEAQKVNYSHVESLHAATTRHALLTTTTKGNRISTIAFTNVKTTTSSISKPIVSHSVYRNNHSRVITSTMKDVLTHSERASFAVRRVKSHVKSAGSFSEASFIDSRFNKAVVSQVKPIVHEVVSVPIIKLTLNDVTTTRTVAARNMKYAIGGNGQAGDGYSYTYIPVTLKSGRIKQMLFAISTGTSFGGSIEVGYAYSKTYQPTAYQKYTANYANAYTVFIEDIPDDVQYLVLKLTAAGISSNSVYAAPIEIGSTTRTLGVINRVYYKDDTINRTMTLGFDVQAPFHAYIYPVISRNDIRDVDGDLLIAKEGATEYSQTNEIDYGDDVTGTQRFYTRQVFTSFSTFTRNHLTFIERLPINAVVEKVAKEVISYVPVITSKTTTHKIGTAVLSSSTVSIKTTTSIEPVVHAESFIEPSRSASVITRAKEAVPTSHTESILSHSAVRLATHAKSLVESISSHATIKVAARSEKIEVTVTSEMSDLGSESDVIKKIKRTSESSVVSISSNSVSSRHQNVLLSSYMRPFITTASQSEAQFTTVMSGVSAIVADVVHIKKKTYTVTTSIAAVGTNITNTKHGTQTVASQVQQISTETNKSELRIVNSQLQTIISSAERSISKHTPIISYVEAIKTSVQASKSFEIIVASYIVKIDSTVKTKMGVFTYVLMSTVKPIKTSSAYSIPNQMPEAYLQEEDIAVVELEVVEIVPYLAAEIINPLEVEDDVIDW